MSSGGTGERVPLIAGNWKMHNTVEEAESLVQALLPRVSSVSGVDVAICPPYPALGPMVDSVRGSPGSPTSTSTMRSAPPTERMPRRRAWPGWRAIGRPGSCSSAR